MKDINEVRSTAADLIREIRDGKLSPEQGRVCRDLLQTVVETAKTEVEFCRVLKSGGTGFLGQAGTLPPATSPSTPGKQEERHLPGGVTRRTEQVAPGVMRTINRAQ